MSDFTGDSGSDSGDSDDHEVLVQLRGQPAEGRKRDREEGEAMEEGEEGESDGGEQASKRRPGMSRRLAEVFAAFDLASKARAPKGDKAAGRRREMDGDDEEGEEEEGGEEGEDGGQGGKKKKRGGEAWVGRARHAVAQLRGVKDGEEGEADGWFDGVGVVAEGGGDGAAVAADVPGNLLREYLGKSPECKELFGTWEALQGAAEHHAVAAVLRLLAFVLRCSARARVSSDPVASFSRTSATGEGKSMYAAGALDAHAAEVVAGRVIEAKGVLLAERYLGTGLFTQAQTKAGLRSRAEASLLLLAGAAEVRLRAFLAKWGTFLERSVALHRISLGGIVRKGGESVVWGQGSGTVAYSTRAAYLALVGSLLHAQGGHAVGDVLARVPKLVHVALLPVGPSATLVGSGAKEESLASAALFRGLRLCVVDNPRAAWRDKVSALVEFVEGSHPGQMALPGGSGLVLAAGYCAAYREEEPTQVALEALRLVLACCRPQSKGGLLPSHAPAPMWPPDVREENANREEADKLTPLAAELRTLGKEERIVLKALLRLRPARCEAQATLVAAVMRDVAPQLRQHYLSGKHGITLEGPKADDAWFSQARFARQLLASCTGTDVVEDTAVTEPAQSMLTATADLVGSRKILRVPSTPPPMPGTASFDSCVERVVEMTAAPDILLGSGQKNLDKMLSHTDGRVRMVGAGLVRQVLRGYGRVKALLEVQREMNLRVDQTWGLFDNNQDFGELVEELDRREKRKETDPEHRAAHCWGSLAGEVDVRIRQILPACSVVLKKIQATSWENTSVLPDEAFGLWLQLATAYAAVFGPAQDDDSAEEERGVVVEPAKVLTPPKALVELLPPPTSAGDEEPFLRLPRWLQVAALRLLDTLDANFMEQPVPRVLFQLHANLESRVEGWSNCTGEEAEMRELSYAAVWRQMALSAAFKRATVYDPMAMQARREAAANGQIRKEDPLTPQLVVGDLSAFLTALKVPESTFGVAKFVEDVLITSSRYRHKEEVKRLVALSLDTTAEEARQDAARMRLLPLGVVLRKAARVGASKKLSEEFKGAACTFAECFATRMVLASVWGARRAEVVEHISSVLGEVLGTVEFVNPRLAALHSFARNAASSQHGGQLQFEGHPGEAELSALEFPEVARTLCYGKVDAGKVLSDEALTRSLLAKAASLAPAFDLERNLRLLCWTSVLESLLQEAEIVDEGVKTWCRVAVLLLKSPTLEEDAAQEGSDLTSAPIFDPYNIRVTAANAVCRSSVVMNFFVRSGKTGAPSAAQRARRSLCHFLGTTLPSPGRVPFLFMLVTIELAPVVTQVLKQAKGVLKQGGDARRASKAYKSIDKCLEVLGPACFTTNVLERQSAQFCSRSAPLAELAVDVMRSAVERLASAAGSPKELGSVYAAFLSLLRSWATQAQNWSPIPGEDSLKPRLEHTTEVVDASAALLASTLAPFAAEEDRMGLTESEACTRVGAAAKIASCIIFSNDRAQNAENLSVVLGVCHAASLVDGLTGAVAWFTRSRATRAFELAHEAQVLGEFLGLVLAQDPTWSLRRMVSVLRLTVRDNTEEQPVTSSMPIVDLYSTMLLSISTEEENDDSDGNVPPGASKSLMSTAEPGNLLSSATHMMSNEGFAELKGLQDPRALSALQIITTTMSALQVKVTGSAMMDAADGKATVKQARKEVCARLWSFAQKGAAGAGRALCAALAVTVYPRGVTDIGNAMCQMAGALSASFSSVNPGELDVLSVTRLRIAEAFLAKALTEAASFRDRKKDRATSSSRSEELVAEAATQVVMGALKGRFMDTEVWRLLERMVALEDTGANANAFRRAAATALARSLPSHSRFYPVMSSPRPPRLNAVDLEALKGEAKSSAKGSAHAERLRKFLEDHSKKAASKRKGQRDAKGHVRASAGDNVHGLETRMADSVVAEVVLERPRFSFSNEESSPTKSHVSALARCLCSAVRVDPPGWLRECGKSGVSLVPLLLSCYSATQGEVDLRILDALATLSEATLSEESSDVKMGREGEEDSIPAKLLRTATVCTYGFVFGNSVGSLHGKLVETGGTLSAEQRVAAWEGGWNAAQARRLAANFPVDRRLPDALWRVLLSHEGTREKLHAMLVPRDDSVLHQSRGVAPQDVDAETSESSDDESVSESDVDEKSGSDGGSDEEGTAEEQGKGEEDEEDDIPVGTENFLFRSQSLQSLRLLLSEDGSIASSCEENDSTWQRDWWLAHDEEAWLSAYGARPQEDTFLGDDSVADPCAYLLSLLLFLFAAHGLGAPQPTVDYPKLMAQGFIAPALAGCSARDPRLRAVAYACLDLSMRGLARAQGGGGRSKGASEAQHLGMLLAKVRNTVTYPCERLPSVLTSFCADASVALANPGDLFGSMVASYILNKGGHRFDLDTIKAPPLFNRTFNDPNPKSQRAFRLWGLRLLTSSLRDAHGRGLVCRGRGQSDPAGRDTLVWAEVPNPGYLHDAERVRRSNLIDAIFIGSGSSYYNAPDGDLDIADRFTLFQGIARFARAHMAWSLGRMEMDPLSSTAAHVRPEALLMHLYRVSVDVQGSAFDCSDGLLKLVHSLSSQAMRDAGSRDVREPMFGISRPDHPVELHRAKLRCSVIQEAALWLDKVNAQAKVLVGQVSDRSALEAKGLHDPTSCLRDHLNFVAISFRDALVAHAKVSRDIVRPGVRLCFPRALVADLLGVSATLARVLQEGHNLGTDLSPRLAAPAMLASAALCMLGDTLLVSSSGDGAVGGIGGGQEAGVGPSLSPAMAARQPVRPLLSPRDASVSWALGGPGRSLLYVLLPHPDACFLFHLNDTGNRTRLQTSIVCWTAAALAQVLAPLVSPDSADRLELRFVALSVRGEMPPPCLESAADAARLALRVAAYAADVVDELCTPERRKRIIGVDRDLSALQRAALRALGLALLRPLPLLRIAKRELQATVATGRGAGVGDADEGASPIGRSLADAVAHACKAEAAFVAALEQLAGIPGLDADVEEGLQPDSLERAIREVPEEPKLGSKLEDFDVNGLLRMSGLAEDFAEKLRFPWGSKPGDQGYDAMVAGIRAALGNDPP